MKIQNLKAKMIVLFVVLSQAPACGGDFGSHATGCPTPSDFSLAQRDAVAPTNVDANFNSMTTWLQDRGTQGCPAGAAKVTLEMCGADEKGALFERISIAKADGTSNTYKYVAGYLVSATWFGFGCARWYGARFGCPAPDKAKAKQSFCVNL